MSEIAVSIENISKSYLIGHRAAQRERSESLREMMVRGVRNAARNAVALARGRQVLQGDSIEEFWAVRNVTFAVKRGEVIGIIGRNGAGKSTLLKILSRVTEPTVGRVILRGRTASLLEVGTGFHGELSGRENIFLNGAILGMTQRDIRKKFDEIVGFAGVEQFLDTPVKRYSSGMYVRLAFSVAAHLEPEILIIDEVLSVGDADFQKKCLGKIDSISRQEGRTVLFVSHNMETVLKFCSRGLLLASGELRDSGPVKDLISRYLRENLSSNNIVDFSTKPRDLELPTRARLVKVTIINNNQSSTFAFGEQVALEVTVDSRITIPDIVIGIGLYSVRGFEFASWTNRCSSVHLSLRPGLNVFYIEYVDLTLLPGQYVFSIGLRSESGVEDYVSEAAPFDVVESELSSEINARYFGGVIVPKVRVAAI